MRPVVSPMLYVSQPTATASAMLRPQQAGAPPPQAGVSQSGLKSHPTEAFCSHSRGDTESQYSAPLG